MKLLLPVLCLLFAQTIYAQSDSLRIYYQLSMTAYEENKFTEFLKYTERANQLRPNHPVFSYNLAAGFALTGAKERTVEALQKYLSMNASSAYLEDTDFKSLSDYAPFTDLKLLLDEKSRRIETTEIHFELDQKNHHFESITHTSGMFLFGSVRSRSVFSHKNGKTESFISPISEPALFSVMGLDVYEKENLLWVCTAALPEMEGYADSLNNRSSLVAIDLNSRGIKEKYLISNVLLGDLIVSKNGIVYATDGLNNKIYRVDTEGLTVFLDLSELTYNLQGLAFDPDEKYLFVSDYITGLYRVDIPSGKVSKVKAKGLYSEKGIDGLLCYSNHLLAFQNGTVPKRSFMIELDAVDLAAKKVVIIDQNIQETGEPTQGVVVDDVLFYISNSAWDSYEKGIYLPEKTSKLQVRKTELIPLLVK